MATDPADALDAMADGRLAMWLPTSTTLQQLEHAGSIDEIRERLAPGPLGAIEVDEVVARGDPDRHAGRWRCGRPARLRLPRRTPPVRAHRPGRPDRSGARSGAGDRDGARRRHRGRSRSPMSIRTTPPAPRPSPSASGSRCSPVRVAVGRCRTRSGNSADLELLDAGDVAASGRPDARSAAGPRCVPGRRRRIRPDRRPRRRAWRPVDPGTRRPHAPGDLAGTPRRPRARPRAACPVIRRPDPV